MRTGFINIVRKPCLVDFAVLEDGAATQGKLTGGFGGCARGETLFWSSTSDRTCAMISSQRGSLGLAAAFVNGYTGPSSTREFGTCSDGTAFSPCFGEVTPAGSETCSDGLDNNCDGSVDEGRP